MVTDMDLKHKSNRYKWYIISLIGFVWLSIALFVLFQHKRERLHKIEQLNLSLQLVNTEYLLENQKGISIEDYYAKNKELHPDIRITLINKNGAVKYDSYKGNSISKMQNHLSRPEIIEALKNGHGYIVRRFSESVKDNFFYSALSKDSIIIRSALPYNVSLRRTLNAGNAFIYFMIALTILISMLGLFTIYRLKETDKELEQEQRRAIFEEEEKIRIKKQLTNNINHELKTPVSGIKACLETILNNSNIDKDIQNKFLTNSLELTIRLEHLLEDVSTITRMDDAPNIIHKTQISVKDIINNVINDIKTEHPNLQIRINTSFINNNKLYINGNEQLIYSIFRNLIDNAIAYSGGRDIYISHTANLKKDNEEFLQFKVADNGIGVENEHLTHLFERFYRIDKGRSRKMGGTGLGLSIVKNAILIHEGTIEVSNRPEGGLEFTFTLKAL